MPSKYRYEVIESYTILFCLYFVQGIPYGFQKDFLPIYLRISGYSLTKVGLLRLVWFPWLLKSLWSPWIDKISTPDKWLTILLALMACNAWICHMIPSTSVQLLITFLTLLNFLTSLQDAAVDGITVTSLSYAQLGAGNIAQIVGYKLGGLFASIVMIKLGWNVFFEILTAIYFFFGIYSYLRLGSILYSKSKASTDCSCEAEQIHDHPTLQMRLKITKLINNIFQKLYLFKYSYKQIFLSTFQAKGTTWMLLFVISYKLGEQAMLSIFPLYLIDLGLSTQFIGFEVRMAQEIFSVIGSLYGGWLAIRINR